MRITREYITAEQMGRQMLEAAADAHGMFSMPSSATALGFLMQVEADEPGTYPLFADPSQKACDDARGWYASRVIRFGGFAR